MDDTIIMEKGMRILVDSLGEVDAERFIVKLIREPFDYTKWQQKLFINMTIDEITKEAINYCDTNQR